MINNRLNYKLVNISIAMFIIFLFYMTRDLWFNIFEIIFPFFGAFIIAYILNIFIIKLKKIGIPKYICILIVFLAISAIVSVIFLLLIPLLFKQLTNCLSGIIVFIKEMSMKYDIDFGLIQEVLYSSFNDILLSFGEYVSEGAFSLLNKSASYISTTIIVITSAIYFLFDMDKIKLNIRKKSKSKKIYEYLIELDIQLSKYISAFVKIMFITFVEYNVVYALIGHPDACLLGVLASLGNLIPYFGGLIVNLIAIMTSFAIGPELFIRSLIIFFIFSIVDAYIINPFVYKKSNEIHPVIVISSVFAGGIIFGGFGIILSLPVAIAIITTYNFYKKDK